ncbi:MAG TPA: BtpA/SgcQ family protein [Phycisphaerales bacterium]|nr:BtpA/SgcQ family protein [Phycisphaerales bacterium]
MSSGGATARSSYPLPPRALVGMIHVDPLPGSPFSHRAVREIASRAEAEARILHDAGFDAIMLENMHDRPYVNGPHEPQITAAMSAIACRVRDVTDRPMGIQILSRGEREALAVALAAGCQFIRCENFVYAHVADEGILPDAAAGPLLRYRRYIGAQHVHIFCDVKKKHASHALTEDISLADAVHSAQFFGADGVIVTGAFTGAPASVGDVAAARSATSLPVLVGSGVEPGQLGELFRHADALIVGSYIKEGGVWSGPVDAARSRALVEAGVKARQSIPPRG